MLLRTSFSAWTAAFFTTLGLSPLTACGGTIVGENGEHDCRKPTPRLGPDGKPTGFDDCEGGSTVRVDATECGSSLPRPGQCTPIQSCDPQTGASCGCTTDADCTERPNGYCGTGGSIGGCACSYGCRKDTDCGADMICFCGDPVGQCAVATCSQKGDCPGANQCMSYVEYPGCPGVAFACQNAADTCASDADCDLHSQCSLQGSARHCAPTTCNVGRPFLVGGAALLANAVRREDWASGASPNMALLDPGTRATLGCHWTEIGLMEHASMAAFARFALEALSLGAPAELLTLTHAAMADEIQHARDAFALASAYGGTPVGPGVLTVVNALRARTPLEIVETTILEGCIGETVAAVEAAEALAHATDPAVREVLTRVTADETRHAELAWKFVRWVLTCGERGLSDATARRLVEIAEAEAEAASASTASGRRATREPALLAHGMLGADERREIRRRVLREIALPCARGLSATVRAGASGSTAQLAA